MHAHLKKIVNCSCTCMHLGWFAHMHIYTSTCLSFLLFRCATVHSSVCFLFQLFFLFFFLFSCRFICNSVSLPFFTYGRADKKMHACMHACMHLFTTSVYFLFPISLLCICTCFYVSIYLLYVWKYARCIRILLSRCINPVLSKMVFLLITFFVCDAFFT